MTTPLAFTDAARHELADVVEYLGPRNPVALRALLDAVERTMALISSEYLEGASVTLATGEEARRYAVRHLVVYYRRTETAVQVLHIWDGRRAPIQR